jgi:hypothetical protein
MPFRLGRRANMRQLGLEVCPFSVDERKWAWCCAILFVDTADDDVVKRSKQSGAVMKP